MPVAFEVNFLPAEFLAIDLGMPNIGAYKSCPEPTQHKEKSEQDFAAPTGSANATQQRGAVLVNPPPAVLTFTL
jgi:hypothetical protein